MQKDPSSIRNGADYTFDPHVVSYWSQWLGHPQPLILIVGQDFSNAGYFVRHHGQDERGNVTNENLRMLLGKSGVYAGTPPVADGVTSVFLTNSVLCLKTGAMSDPIKDRWVRNCSKAHLLPLIHQLSPKIIIGMGKHGWAAVRQALNITWVPQQIGLAAGEQINLSGKTIFPVGHCSGLGLVNRPMEKQIGDWKRIGVTVLQCSASSLEAR